MGTLSPGILHCNANYNTTCNILANWTCDGNLCMFSEQKDTENDNENDDNLDWHLYTWEHLRLYVIIMASLIGCCMASCVLWYCHKRRLRKHAAVKSHSANHITNNAQQQN